MKQSKKRIVLGVCGGLLSLWLLFLTGFTGWQIAAQREKDLNDIAALLDAGDETVGGVWETQLQRDYSASAVDIDAAVSANAFATSYLNQMAAGQEMALALYSPKPELITYNKPELMLQVEIPYKHLPSSVFDIFYCSMNPFDYMDEDSAKTLMEYASYESPMTNGCVSSYSIMVSMWTDGAQIVPRSIYVLPRWYLCGDDWARAGAGGRLNSDHRQRGAGRRFGYGRSRPEIGPAKRRMGGALHRRNGRAGVGGWGFHRARVGVSRTVR